MEDHPPDTRLQRYLDAELDASSRRVLAEHIARCSPCREKMCLHESIRRYVRQAAPICKEFCAEGEFWSRLVARLPAQPNLKPPSRPLSRWPFVPYVPPILLGIPGTLLQGLLPILFTLQMLMGIGILPSIGNVFTTRLIPLLAHPILEHSLYDLMGWSGQEVTGHVLQSWTRMSAVTQDALILAIALLLLVTLFFGVAILYIGWVVCWSGTSPSYPKRR